MNLELFKNPDPSGKMSKESFLSKNYIEEYNYIIEYCLLNNLIDLPFKEKVYLSINKLKCVPICKNTNCNNKVKFKNSTIGYLSYCSNKCISSDQNIKDIKEFKSIEKYGTKVPAQSDKIKEKIILTNQKKYGGNSPMSSKEIQKKSTNTLINNWGVDNPSKSKEILNRRIESFRRSNYKENFKISSLKKYGVEHPWMNKNIHKKTIDSFYFDYINRIKSKIDIEKYKFIDLQKGISTSIFFHCYKCTHDFSILTSQFYWRVNNNKDICTNCYPISENASISQIELYNFIKDNYKGNIILDCKNIIAPYEIDIYLPDIKVGFEFNGVWWHSNKYKSDNYHLDKWKKSQINEIYIFSVWEDDWNTKRDICKSFILNKIKKTRSKIFARKCIIREVDYNSSKLFLDENHLQGDCKSSLRIGLFYENELVSLMTFSKLRLPLQKKEENRNRDNYYELTRFCNKINHNIVGGASKLLNFFINKYKPFNIETYSDNLISDGDLYNKLGFKYHHTSKPGYWYLIDGIRKHRFNYRKHILVKKGYDINKSEGEIMSELGYIRIYNAGNKKWIWKNK